MHLADQEEEKRGAAESIAEEAGVIERCPDRVHMTVLGSADPGAAFELGNRKRNAGKLEGVFASAKEMSTYIQSAIDNAGADCEACAMQEDD